MVVSRVKEAARRIVRPHLRCVTGEAQDFLAEMFFAIVVADTQMAFLTGTADDQLAQERGRWITRHLATLTNLSGEPNCSRAKTGLFRPSKTAPSVCHRSEEHTSELQSLIRNSYDDFCSKTTT